MKYIMDDKPNWKEMPKQPGCYIFRNKSLHIIYIGKSKSLCNRIKQHFHNTDPTDYKHMDLMRELHEIEFVLTDTETNALILECQLIKQHKPKYNSQLKRGRIYPFIRVNLQQPYPTFVVTDRTAKDGCEYFGSFYDKYDALATLELINSIWRTPICCKDSFDDVQRPCLHHHLNKCCAPCCGEIDAMAYRQIIREIIKCLHGNFRATVSRLRAEMEAASNEMSFEKAARLRDNIIGLDKLKKKQKSIYTDLDGKDIYLFFRAFRENGFSLFFIRNGVTFNRVDFADIQELDKEKLAAFVSGNAQGQQSIKDGAFLTTCLLEIGACKLFIPVSRRGSSMKIIAKLEKGFEEFTE